MLFAISFPEVGKQRESWRKDTIVSRHSPDKRLVEDARSSRDKLSKIAAIPSVLSSARNAWRDGTVRRDAFIRSRLRCSLTPVELPVEKEADIHWKEKKKNERRKLYLLSLITCLRDPMHFSLYSAPHHLTLHLPPFWNHFRAYEMRDLLQSRGTLTAFQSYGLIGKLHLCNSLNDRTNSFERI